MENILGHENIKRELYENIIKKELSHAYMFEGLKGIGKLSLAKEFSKIVMCEKGDKIACNSCNSCKVFENSPDFKIIYPEGTSIKVEQIKTLNDDILLKPIVSDKKIYIIDDAELMNEQAQNKLLKTLEEPPQYAIIILIVSNKDKVIKTIKSRCTMLHFSPLDEDMITSYFKDKVIDKEIISYARGSIGKVYSLLKNNYIGKVSRIIELLKNKDLLNLNEGLEIFKNNIEDINDMLEYLSFYYFKNMKDNYKINLKRIDIIEECKNNIRRNANVDLALDNMMIRLYALI